MTRSITCGNCGASLGLFEAATGCIVEPQISGASGSPVGVQRTKVFGAYLICGCGKSTKFDGVRARKKLAKAADSRRV